MATANFAESYRLPIEYGQSAREVVDCSDVVVIATAWCEYVNLLTGVADKPVVDLRHCLKPPIDDAEQPTP